MAEHGNFHWNELNTWDAEKAMAFYGATLGWTFEAMPMAQGGTYHIAMLDSKPVAGIFPMTKEGFEGIPEHWFAYIAVDDVDARAKLATEHGGKAVRDPMDFPGVGRIIIMQDANGGYIGWITPAEMT